MTMSSTYRFRGASIERRGIGSAAAVHSLAGHAGRHLDHLNSGHCQLTQFETGFGDFLMQSQARHNEPREAPTAPTA